MMRALDLKTVSDDGKWVVSTVQLASPAARIIDTFLNPEYLADSFETMVFPAGVDGEVSDWQERYRCGYADMATAEAGHEVALIALNAGQLELYATD